MNKSDMTVVMRVLGKIKVLGKQEVYDNLNKLFSSARASYAPLSPLDTTSAAAAANDTVPGGAGRGEGGEGGGGARADMTIAGARTSYPRTSWVVTAESFCGMRGDRSDDCVSESQFVALME